MPIDLPVARLRAATWVLSRLSWRQVIEETQHARADPAADLSVIQVLASGIKVKRRRPRMRACNELNAKGKLCAGHLKRWYHPSAEVKAAVGALDEFYRCEHCHTVYLPNLSESPRTRTLVW
jgi:hypothetical protein